MARNIIDIGIQGNDGTGDSIRESFRKVNENFSQLFSIFGSGETITFSDLDDTPDSYTAGQILISDETGETLLAKTLVAGAGITINNNDPNSISIISAGSQLLADDQPTLGNDLNANGRIIANVSDFTALTQTEIDNSIIAFNNLHGTTINEDDVVISRGYGDRRYLQASGSSGTSGSQVRVRSEPIDVNGYTYIVDDWASGYLSLPGHGFNTAINGAAFIYNHTGGFPATNLVGGSTYYFRYFTPDLLGIYPTAIDAENDTNRILVNEPPVDVAQRGIETFVDEFYDSTLEGNWLSNEALPRESIVRRQGDTMTGALTLHDHPGELAGAGLPNGPDDLQAATKFYVDNSSFASTANLYVASSGDDTQAQTPPGREGRALAYAYRTVQAACEKAEELMNASLTEPGPYSQQVTYNNGLLDSVVTSSSTLTPSRRSLLVFTNGQGADQSRDPDNKDLREGSIIKGLASGATAKVITYTGTIVNDDEYVVELLHTTTDPVTFEANYIFAEQRLLANNTFIEEETIAYIGSRYSSLIYNEVKCRRDIGYIIDAVAFDIKYGGNRQTLDVAKTYWRGVVSVLPSDQISQTADAINYIFLLAEQIIDNNVIGPAPDANSFGIRTAEPQDTIGTVGEAGSIELTQRLVSIITDIVENGLTGSGTLLEFTDGEELEYGQLVPELQISVMIETGIYYEQLPIKVPTNVSIKGDEFRRTIIRPAPGQSLSPWAGTYFFRDDEFDGLTRTYTSTASAISAFNTGAQEWRVVVDSTAGLEPDMYLKVLSGTGDLDILTQVKNVLSSIEFSITLAPTTPLSGAVVQGLNSSNLAPTGQQFGYHYLIDPTDLSSPPKENDDMDVFLMNDAGILRNITCQGHGGFMAVLDPEGQIQTKSPYFQTCTSLSGSTGQQRFAGGMLIDGSAGNLPASITTKTSNFELEVSGLDVRLPQVPTAFYVEGRRYQVNSIEETSPGVASLFLDSSSNASVGYDESEFTVDTGVVARDIIFETAGNRSMLANDYTQVNDLGYGAIATNNGITELVSIFTYYCWTSYYAVNGGQVRSTQGNSSYGQYGMRALGRDPTEVPDPVALVDNTLQVASIYKRGVFSSRNLEGEISLYIENYEYVPTNISEIEIDHSNLRSSIAPNTPTFTNNVVLSNPGSGYAIGQLLKPDTGVTYDNNSYTGIIVLAVGGSGEITDWELFDAGQYSVAPIPVKQTAVFTVDDHPENTVNIGSGAGAQFTGTYVGNRTSYEVSSIELTTALGDGFDEVGAPITTLPVLRLNLNLVSGSGLQADLENGQLVTIRGLQNFKFNGIEEVRPVRPSTALEFTDPSELGSIYRTLAYNLNDAIGGNLEIDEAILSFDSSYDYIILQTNAFGLLDTDYIDGGPKTMGGTIGDTRIAVEDADPSDQARLNSGDNIVGWAGKLFRITSYVAASGPNSAYVELDETGLGLGFGSIVSGTGISEALPIVEQTILRAGLTENSPAQITVRISTCRASGHDFLDVGTGGFNSSNYPNNLYGAPVIAADQSKEVREESQGRVFYVSTDQNGIFRIGKFFTVDQGTGTVTFAASIALSNLDGIGFKRGTVVKEFSTDDTMTDVATDSVPTESAVVGYINKRLGITQTGGIVPTGERIPVGSGFLAVDGTLAMTGSLNMQGGVSPNRIINLADPTAPQDAATRNYVDILVGQNDELSELTDVTIAGLALDNTLVYNGSEWVNGQITNNSVDASAAIVQSKLALNPSTTRADAVGITQADLGSASFDSANFEVTNGWVGIRAAGVALSEIATVSNNTVLANVSGGVDSPTAQTVGTVTSAGLDEATPALDLTSNVLSIRKNALRTGPSSTFTNFIGSAVAGLFTVNNVPARSVTGTGNGARVNVTYTGGGYTAVTVAYGGSGYAEGDELRVDGALLNGVSVANDFTFTIAVTGSNLAAGPFIGINRVSISAESDSIVSTDSGNNLGNNGNRFNTIYTTNASVSGVVLTNELQVSDFIEVGVDNNIILTAAQTTQGLATPIAKNITIVSTVPANTGVRMPIPDIGGYRLLIRNSSGTSMRIWPNVGAQINTLGNNVPFIIPGNSALEFFSASSTQWFTVNATFAG